MTLDDPLFPGRSGVDPRSRALAEATALGGTAAAWRMQGTVTALEHWARGGSFHAYGLQAHDALIADGMSLRDALEQMRLWPSHLKFQGHLRGGGGRGMWWGVSYRRVGLPDESGGNSGYSTVEDCAYAALTLIEKHERQVYEENLVVGLA